MLKMIKKGIRQVALRGYLRGLFDSKAQSLAKSAPTTLGKQLNAGA